jgi:hypothetical protein
MTQSQALPLWLDKLGDWNPQLLRELKGRLSWRSVLLTMALVTIVQVLWMMNYIQQIPTEANINLNSTYCIGKLNPYSSIPTWAECRGIDWKRWWRDIFNVQNGWIAFIIYLPAVYFLISDINQEIQRGTINFLRLSPRSTQTILLGKLLGVPCLTYLALALLIPLHLLCGTMAGISPTFFLSYYSTFVLFGAVLLTGALFIGFSHRNTGNKSASTAVSSSIFLGLLIAGGVVIPVFWQWNYWVLWSPFIGEPYPRPGTPEPFNWFFLTLNQSPIVTHLFTFTHLTIVTAFLWNILQRVFQNPTATLISKRQSYALMPYFVLFIIGFRHINSSSGSVELAEFLAPWIFVGLIFALSTVRQTWFEWICYRQTTQPETGGSARIQPSRTDLILGEKSPGLTAIGLNLLLVVGIIATALLFEASGTLPSNTFRNWLGLILMIPLVINYALLVQWMLMLKTQKRSTWAIGSVFFAIGLPSVIGGLFTSFGNRSPIGTILLMCSPWYRAMLSSGNEGSSDSFDFSNLTIALLIQAIALLFLASRVWAEYRKMSRS